MTRARDELWLSMHASGPRGRGRRRPSPFIAEALDLPIEAEPRAVGSLEALSAAMPDRVAQPESDVRVPPPTVLSFSQVEEYLNCPERYRLRHVVGLPVPHHHLLSYGQAMHAAVASFHVRAAWGEAPSTETLLDDFRQAWTPDGFLSREHEEARFEAGQRALRLFRDQQIASPPNVVAVERPFEFTLGGVRVRGRMDRVDRAPDGAVIVDYKSSEIRDQRKADERARESLQLQVYALAHERGSGELPARMQLHFLDSGMTGGTTPDRRRLDKAEEKVVDAAQGIRAGIFPAKPNPVACGYCPFRQVCPSSAA
jgi:DNA helicase-2/ATP-dependent DNA helicase PcrA